MRIYPKLDRNQHEIVAGLRTCGVSVQSLAAIGGGCPDLMVGHRGQNYLLELKDGALPPSRRTLTPDQKLWHLEWKGDVVVVTSLTEALAAMGLG